MVSVQIYMFGCFLASWLVHPADSAGSKVRITNTHLLQPFYLEAAAVAEGALPLRRLTARRLWKQRNTHGFFSLVDDNEGVQ